MGQHERSAGPEAKLRAVSRSCREGRTCPEAVFLAYRGELGFRWESARRLAKELPRTLGEPGLCEVFAAAFSILELLKHDGSGSGNGTAPGLSYRDTAACLRKEYGSWSCGELEGGGRSDPELCRMRMKDCVLLMEREREIRGLTAGAGEAESRPDGAGGDRERWEDDTEERGSEQ